MPDDVLISGHAWAVYPSECCFSFTLKETAAGRVVVLLQRDNLVVPWAPASDDARHLLAALRQIMRCDDAADALQALP